MFKVEIKNVFIVEGMKQAFSCYFLDNIVKINNLIIIQVRQSLVQQQAMSRALKVVVACSEKSTISIIRKSLSL
jgi:hypothetical protein